MLINILTFQTDKVENANTKASTGDEPRSSSIVTNSYETEY